MKKLIALMLCVVFLIGMAPTVLAEGNPGPGGEDDPPVGDGTTHTVTVIQPVNGTITAIGMVDYSVGVLDRENQTFTIIPADGYMVSKVLITEGSFTDDWSWNLIYNGDGSFDFLLEDVQSDLEIEIVFEPGNLDVLLEQNYVVLEKDASEEKIKSSLAMQLSSSGYPVTLDKITVSDITTVDTVSGYGTFKFTVAQDEGENEVTSAEQTGYIVSGEDDVIFKLTDGENIKICVARNMASPDAPDEVEVPAMYSGTMEIFGYGNLIAARLDGDTLEDGKVRLPFYRAQFHIFSFFSGINNYGLYVIQEDAFCVQVAAESGTGEQRTHTWDLGRYADITEGSCTSEVYFGNDEFVLSLPSSGIGGVSSLEVDTGAFNGYTVDVNEDGTYSVLFLSDYYDFVTIDLTINGSIQRQLHIHRVGIHIEPYVYENGPPSFTVFHGTQSGTIIDFSDNNLYRIYGTYYIPDNGSDAPYGLYVIYSWQDGSTTTEIITTPCNTPAPMSEDIFSNGVYDYGENYANACDYLLYSGPNAQNAPVTINVTVLKGDPTASDFGGVFFGSGAGITWDRIG